MSNFSYLQAEWPDLFDEARRAEEAALHDPRTSCFYARRTLELALNWLYRVEAALVRPAPGKLHGKVNHPSMAVLAGPHLVQKMEGIRLTGNDAVHKTAKVRTDESVRITAELFHVMYWFARLYTRDQANLPADGLTFDRSLLPKPESATDRVRKMVELQRMEEENKRRDAELAAAREQNSAYEAEVAQLRAQVAEAKAANSKRPDTHDYDEAQTRELFIDLLLKESGWTLDNPRDREFPVTGMPNESGNGSVDYVLWGDNGKPLGLVEAKRTGRNSFEGQHQAKLYADCLEKQFGQRPVIYFSNGYETYVWDDTFYPPRRVQGFHTRDELHLLVQRRAGRGSLSATPITESIAGRPYQQRAIRAVGDAFENDRKRRALAVMATGSGKTRTTIALVDQLMRAGWVKNVLFLADRKALVRQTVNAFKQHLGSSNPVNLLTEKNSEGRVYVSTYPTMMNLIDETGDGGRRRFGPGHFDLVIVDEAHRSVYKKFGAIFDYFDALLLGLTATPKEEVDRNTYRLFDLSDGVPTFSYDLEEAAHDGYLVMPRAVNVPLKIPQRGVRYDELSEEEKEQWDEAEWDEDGNVPTEVTPDEVNKYLFNENTIDLALEVLMNRGHRVAGGDRLGKTIVFAKGEDHARFIVERFNRRYPQCGPDFAQVITSKSDYADSLLDDFSTFGKAPHIAVSVDMLDTGIDVPEVVNLVLFKPVYSRTKFWQMLGRGTRLCPDLFGPDRHKEDFYVFDLCRNVEYFSQDLPAAEGRVAPSLGERLLRTRLDLVYTLDSSRPDLPEPADGAEPEDEAGVRWSHARHLHRVIAGMDPDNFQVRPRRRWVHEFGEAGRWRRIDTEAHEEVGENLLSLPTSYRPDGDTSEEAKRFDLLSLSLQLAVLTGDPAADRLRRRAQDIASALEDLTAVPAVLQQIDLVRAVAGDDWWVGVTLPMLERMRLRLRGLVRLIERGKRKIVFTDFRDELGEVGELEIRGVPLGTDWTRFKTRVRNYLRRNPDEAVGYKLRANESVNEAELERLLHIFQEEGLGSQEDIDRAVSEDGGLGMFIRRLEGMDRVALEVAFLDFYDQEHFGERHRRYLERIWDYLEVNGELAMPRLWEHPFLDLAPDGPQDLFSEDELKELHRLLTGIRANAVPGERTAE